MLVTAACRSWYELLFAVDAVFVWVSKFILTVIRVPVGRLFLETVRFFRRCLGSHEVRPGAPGSSSWSSSLLRVARGAAQSARIVVLVVVGAPGRTVWQSHIVTEVGGGSHRLQLLPKQLFRATGAIAPHTVALFTVDGTWLPTLLPGHCKLNDRCLQGSDRLPFNSPAVGVGNHLKTSV